MIACGKASIVKLKYIFNLVIVTKSRLHLALFAKNIPKGFKFSLKHQIWKDAMSDEILVLHQNKTWTLVPMPKGLNVVRSKWVFRTKFHSDGSNDRQKDSGCCRSQQIQTP